MSSSSSTHSRGKARKIRVVVADDHTIFREGLRKLLSLEPDLDVVGEAENGPRTVELVEKLKPDVVLLDLRMPGGSGIVALQRLQDRLKSTRVIVLTASDEEQEVVESVRLGACGVVRKESTTDLLVKSIRKVCEGEVWLDTQLTAAVMREFADPNPAPAARPKSLLSAREREIVNFVCQGYRNKEIAGKMFISEQTVKNHLHNIFDKLGVSDRLELALYAIHKKLNEPTAQ